MSGLVEGVTFNQAVASFAHHMNVPVAEYTKFLARAKNMLRPYPGQTGWEPLLPSQGRGKELVLSNVEALTLYVALQLNVVGIMPSILIRAAKKAIANRAWAGPVLHVTIPAALGKSSVTVPVRMPQTLIDQHYEALAGPALTDLVRQASTVGADAYPLHDGSVHLQFSRQMSADASRRIIQLLTAEQSSSDSSERAPPPPKASPDEA